MLSCCRLNTVITVTLIIIVMMKMWFLRIAMLSMSITFHYRCCIWHIIIMIEYTLEHDCMYILLTMIIIWWKRRHQRWWWTELNPEWNVEWNSIYINLSIFVVSGLFVSYEIFFSVWYRRFYMNQENLYSDRFQETFYMIDTYAIYKNVGYIFWNIINLSNWLMFVRSCTNINL